MEYSKILARKRKQIEEAESALKATKEAKLLQRRKESLKALIENCPHEKIESKHKSYSGSTHSWNECIDCGKRSETEVKTHNWYS
jgi:nitrite reductase/ring-hydroxylating ferredoxin subunit